VAGRGWETFSRGRLRRIGGGAALLALLVALGPGASVAGAVVPTVGASWSSAIFSSTARLHAEVNPNSLFTTYHFDYTTKAAYDADRGRGGDGFTGASRIPAVSDANVGSGSSFVTVLQLLSTLQADTVYRYRVVARNSSGTTTFPPGAGAYQTFVTFPISTGALLPDGRGWEMVSPVDKNGGEVDPPGGLADGGVLQAAVGGGAVTYGSAAAFGAGSVGAPSASQYISSRTGGGWSTQNISVPLFSGSYDTETDGVPYRLFSGDLARGLLLSGKHCRGDDASCPVANPPLPGTDAPAGYQNYYLRESAGPSFEALLGASDIAELNTDPADFALSFVGASPDLRTVVLSTCAALTPGATDGCGTARANLYRWSGGSLSLINATPGAALAAQSGAVSTDGSRIYWKDLTAGNLFQGIGAGARQVDAGAGGGGTFETASTDGSLAFYTKAGDLWRYTVGSDSSTRLTSSGDVAGVLGASTSGSHLYYLTATGLVLCNNAATATANQCDTVAATRVAESADVSTYPPTTGTARVSADGTKLVFVATTPLTRSDGTRYDNTDLNTRVPDSQVYLYDATTAALTCVSCNPSNGRPVGPSSIPGATRNGSSPEATVSYKPRVLSADGRRVYFDSDDALVLSDTNNDTDAYQWEAQGSGNCTRAGGCIALISSGRATGGATFVDASADGSDAFFLTDESLVNADPGSVDLYDARIGGGFPVPNRPIPCNGDACQILPPEPIDPTLTTLLSGPGNPPVRYVKYGKTCPKNKQLKTVTKKNGKKIKKCVKKGRQRRFASKHGGRR
jgi:hypothetical protein